MRGQAACRLHLRSLLVLQVLQLLLLLVCLQLLLGVLLLGVLLLDMGRTGVHMAGSRRRLGRPRGAANCGQQPAGGRRRVISRRPGVCAWGVACRQECGKEALVGWQAIESAPLATL